MIALWLKLKGYAAALGGLLVVLLGAVLYGRAKGKAAEQVKTRAAQDAATAAQAKSDQLESRHETDGQVQRMPDAPAQTVGDAAAGTAAGELRDSWTRD